MALDRLKRSYFRARSMLSQFLLLASSTWPFRFMHRARAATEVGEGCRIAPSAWIADRGVRIGRECSIGERAVLQEGTVLGDGVVVGSGAVIGGQGFICIWWRSRLVPIFHRGGVRIGDRSRIGPMTCIDKSRKHVTVIGRDVLVGSAIHIAHDVRIGDGCVVSSGAMVAGHVELEEGAALGANSNIVNRLKVGKGASVSSGAVVTKDLKEAEAVAGNFALGAEKHAQRMRMMVTGESGDGS